MTWELIEMLHFVTFLIHTLTPQPNDTHVGRRMHQESTPGEYTPLNRPHMLQEFSYVCRMLHGLMKPWYFPAVRAHPASWPYHLTPTCFQDQVQHCDLQSIAHDGY